MNTTSFSYAVEWRRTDTEGAIWHFITDNEDDILEYCTAEEAKNRIEYVRANRNALSLEYRVVKITKEVVE